MSAFCQHLLFFEDILYILHLTSKIHGHRIRHFYKRNHPFALSSIDQVTFSHHVGSYGIHQPTITVNSIKKRRPPTLSLLGPSTDPAAHYFGSFGYEFLLRGKSSGTTPGAEITVGSQRLPSALILVPAGRCNKLSFGLPFDLVGVYPVTTTLSLLSSFMLRFSCSSSCSTIFVGTSMDE